MINLRALLASVPILFFMVAVSQAKDWRGIVPLYSTRADVERLLGKPNAKFDRYDIGDEVADITYSSGTCANGWNVTKDTVILISVTYHRTLRLSDLQIDLSKFERAPDPYTTNHIYYNNGEEGIRYVVSEGVGPTRGTILNVYYEPSRKDMHLFCPSKDDDTKDPGPLMTHCPMITIGCKDRGPLPVTFSVIYSPPIEKVSFKWTVSEGTIIEGQGTPAITVTAPAGVKKITATVLIDGFPKGCSNTESCSTDVTVSRTATIQKSKGCPTTSTRRIVRRREP
jgi:hypothetical protein